MIKNINNKIDNPIRQLNEITTRFGLELGPFNRKKRPLISEIKIKINKPITIVLNNIFETSPYTAIAALIAGWD